MKKKIHISGKLKILKASFILLFVFACVPDIDAQNFQWARSFGANNDDNANGIFVDASGNVYTTGYFQGTVDFDPGPGVSSFSSAGTWDIYIQKLDANGNFLWARAFGSASYDLGAGIGVDAMGNVYTAGTFTGSIDFDPGPGTAILTAVAGSGSIFIQKLDANGNYLWARSYGASLGGGGNALVLDASGNSYSTGSYSGTGDFDPGPGTYTLSSAGDNDIFIQKMDANGNFVWVKSIGSLDDDVAYAIKLDGAGNIYTTGNYQGTVDFNPGPGVNTLTFAGILDIFVQKLDPNGNYVWARSFGGAGYDCGNSIAVDPSGSVFTTGFFEGTADFNPGANVYNLTAPQGSASFVQKLNASGNFLWAKSFGHYGTGITTDAAGNVYTTGLFSGTVDFDPGPAVHTITSAATDVFVQKMNPLGNYVWAGSFSGPYLDFSNAITTDADGNVYTAGYYGYATTDFDPGPAVYNLTSNGLGDVFVQKMCFPAIPVNTTPAANLTICSGDSAILTATGNGILVWYADSMGVNYMGTGNVFTTPNLTDTNTFYVFDTTLCSAGITGITVIVIPVSTSITNISICPYQLPYLWNAQSLDSSGTYAANFTSAIGCDSLAVLNFDVMPCGPCLTDITINSNPFTDSLTQSQTWIITSGAVLIPAGAKVKLDAHTDSYVTINPGFKAEYGSVFVAQAYNGCNAGAPQLPQTGKVFKGDIFESDKIVLYPNPTSGMIHIKHDEKLTGIQIFDMVGKLVINQKCAGETETNIDLSNLPNGVYHVRAAGYNSIKVIKNN